MIIEDKYLNVDLLNMEDKQKFRWTINLDGNSYISIDKSLPEYNILIKFLEKHNVPISESGNTKILEFVSDEYYEKHLYELCGGRIHWNSVFNQELAKMFEGLLNAINTI